MSKKIFFIAGEPSGDALGANLIKELKTKSGDIEIIGIGGTLMEKQGLKSLLPMDELCVMGLVEVLGQLPRLLRLINGVVEEIEERQPDIVVTIDLPDFNFQVGSRLKKRGKSKAKLIHYVAPTVWAWREKRALKVSKFLDGILCLFPFEPKYFEKYKLPAKFVGHSIVENDFEEIDISGFRQEYGIGSGQKTVGLFLGSREGELKKLSGTLIDTVRIMAEQVPDLAVIVPTLPHLEFEVRRIFDDCGIKPVIVYDPDKKWQAFAACDVGLAVSGTVGLELAYMKVPHIIGYKMNNLSWGLVRLLVKVKNAHLANILLKQNAVPEFLQADFDSIKMAKAALKLLMDEKTRLEQISLFEKLHTELGTSPSEKAAEFILGYIDNQE